MQRYAINFTPRAERQLASLFAYIADQSGEARADNYVSGIVAHCLSLSTFPARGTKRDDIRLNLRTMGYARSATIAFSINDTTAIVTIMACFMVGRTSSKFSATPIATTELISKRSLAGRQPVVSR